MLYVELAIVLLLIALNGFLAMSELAVVSARRSRLQSMAAGGHRGAKTALDLLANSGRFLSSVLIGISMIGILAGVFSGATLAERLAAFLKAEGMAATAADTLAFAGVVIVVTYISLIAGELVPKQLALRRPNRTAAAVAPAMSLVARIAAPAVWLLDGSTRLVLRVFKAQAPTKSSITEDEIKTLVAEAETAGVVEPEERSMIARVMRLGDKTVRTIMTPRHEVAWLDLNGGEESVRETLLRVPHSRMPAANGSLDDVVGAVLSRKLLNELLAGRALDLAACVDQVPHVSEHMSALEVIDALRESPARMALVFDEYGHFEGIVTDGDILRAIAGGLIEQSEDQAAAIQRDDGTWLIDGAMRIDEAADTLNLAVPSERDYQTLAGLILHELQQVPDTGDTLDYEGWRFEIVDMDGRRIDKVLAMRLHPAPRRIAAG
ncbi:MAG: hemolysin family protein [Alphaproteobacteria bacterium]